MSQGSCELCGVQFNSDNEPHTIENVLVGLPFTICDECVYAAHYYTITGGMQDRLLKEAQQ